MINLLNNSLNWVKFKHVFSHSGNQDFLSRGNEIADNIATLQMKKQKIQIENEMTKIREKAEHKYTRKRRKLPDEE